MEAVIYVRQSQDRTGEGAAVERQEAECRAFASQRGLTITRLYADNDASATSGKVRPQFEAMLRDRPRVIVSWHQDRLLRVTKDLERVIELNVPVYTVTAGTLDLSTPAGRAVARTVAAWSTYEGEQKAVRQVASNRQRAARGSWTFSRRPFGYERVDGEVVLVPDEAAVLQEGYARFIGGDTYYGIAKDWNARGILSATGAQWSMTQVRDRLANPFYAGISLYKGQVMGDGSWEPVIDRATWDRFTAAKERRARPHGWSNRTKYLGSGLFRCGTCDEPVLARPEYRKNPDGTRRTRMTYQCTAKWCVCRGLEDVDATVRAVLFARLAAPDAAELLQPSLDVKPLMVEADELSQRRDDLAALLAEGVLTPAAVREQSAALTGRIDALHAQIRDAAGDASLSLLIGAEDVEQAFDRLPFRAQRDVIDALATVRIGKARSTRVFDPESVGIEWKAAG